MAGGMVSEEPGPGRFGAVKAARAKNGLKAETAAAQVRSNQPVGVLKSPHGYERQLVYVYGAMSPVQDQLEWKITPNMNIERMNEFLTQISQAHGAEFLIMVVDGASSHKSQDLRIPENMRFLQLPGYSPELNPQEHVWDALREKEFLNRVFDSLEGVVRQLELGLPRLAGNSEGLRSLTAWPWIISLNLNAN
jgi:hypothetical protein